MINKEQIADIVIEQRNALLLTDQASGDNVKAISRELFDYIKKTTRQGDLGNTREEFAKQHLIPALKETSHVFQELQKDIFP